MKKSVVIPKELFDELFYFFVIKGEKMSENERFEYTEEIKRMLSDKVDKAVYRKQYQKKWFNVSNP